MKMPKGFVSLGKKNEWINVDCIVDIYMNEHNKAVIVDKYGREFQVDPKLVETK